MKRRRFIPPDKARAAVLGGFYQNIPLPGTFTCTACREQRHAFGQEDGLCLKCRWTRWTKVRQDGGAADDRSTFTDQATMLG
jgi:hypothetical protein